MTTAKGKPRGRPFPKGVSGNPGGRPKGFTARIQGYCGDDYDRIAHAYAVIAWGTAAQRAEFFGESVRVSARDRLQAISELRDSGPGKPTQAVAVQNPDGTAIHTVVNNYVAAAPAADAPAR